MFEERLNLAVENAEAGVFDTDLLTEKTFRSMKHSQIYGYRGNTQEWTLEKVREHMLPEDLVASNEAYLQSFYTGVLNHSFRIKRADGVTRWVNTTGKVVRDGYGRPVRIIGTVIDITDKKELEKQKDEFISTVSHELKTPVTSIKAYNQFLSRSLIGAENSQNRKFLERMDNQIDRLQTLIIDLLDITRVEQNKLALRQEALQLDILLEEVVSELQMITSGHRLLIIKNTPVAIISDKGRLTQVITNLITNAVKYSPSSDLVNIRLKKENGQAIFSIQDLGVGIPVEHQNAIFERFHQLGQENAQAGLNLGLGLYISKEIVQMAGGNLWCESEPGKGSTFYFSLPLNN
jgi:PAS domain S-box-containing protein